MKNSLFISVILATTISFASCNNFRTEPVAENTVSSIINKPIVDGNTKIQVALLLDTSGSMDGLIEQAKSRLWNIVNTLTTLKYDGKTPDIEISLYEYGNSGLSSKENYIKQIIPLSTDLDLISEKLFALSTNGGEEYCGAVIQDATRKLQWGKESNNMKLIYVCGNEAFNQGGINYKESIAEALKNDIYINTIFCGNQQEGINTFWKNGADVGKGKYFNIDSNQIVEYVATPFDDEITKCNDKINDTYINYGTIGYEKKASQMKEDSNAKTISAANMTARAVSKSKAVYKNESWDLVDKAKQDKEIITKIKKSELPAAYQNKTNDELKAIVSEKSRERESIQKKIGELAKKRQEYIDNNAKKATSKTKDDLGNAINTSIVSFAKVKGYTVDK
jgi:uncharacterized coiled-coil protein SlyX